MTRSSFKPSAEDVILSSIADQLEDQLGEVCSNLEKLLCSCLSYRDLEGLVGKGIKLKWKDEDMKSGIMELY